MPGSFGRSPQSVACVIAIISDAHAGATCGRSDAPIFWPGFVSVSMAYAAARIPSLSSSCGSVDWWRSLHQTATITRLDPTIEGTMLFTLMLGIVAFGLVFAWLLVHRFRVGWLEERAGASGLDDAIVERRSEAGLPVAGGAG